MNAPDIVRRPLPGFPGWWRALGPGIVWMALAQGSGELIWWPYLVAKYGLLLLFLLIPSCLLQYPLNLEIGRYTLLTGESIFRGFLRLHRGFGIALWILMTLSFLWFGAFATAGGTALAALTGFPAGWSPRGQTLFWGYASIALFGAALVFSGVVYRLIENVMKVVAVVTVVGLVWACLEPEVLRQIPSFARGLLGPPPGPPPRAWDPADATKLLTGITFAGLGGFWILLYSYWLGEKGAGMAGYSAPITGLRSGSTEYRVPSTEYQVPSTEDGEAARGSQVGSADHAYSVLGTRYSVPDDSPDSHREYSTWRKYLTIDALIGITGNLFTTLLTCLLAWALLFPKGLLPQDYELAVVQSRFFEVSWGPVGRVVFLLVAAAFLADTWLATADGVSRMQADIVTALFPRATGGSMRRWYWICLGLLTVVTCLTMLLEAPGPLILLSAVIGFAGTVVFPAALYVLNYRRLPRVLPEWAKPARASALLLGVSLVCYLGLAVMYVREVVK
jgi:Mn2+/Fe2+ NRAMP family transporter